jgi:hypothetical protein
MFPKMQPPNVLSTHRHPRPRVSRAISWALVVGILLLLLAIPCQISFSAAYNSPLWIGTAIFTLILIIPVTIFLVLHPEIDVTAEGLRLNPTQSSSEFVPWNKIEGIVPHPLVFNDDAMGRVMHGKRYRRREGIVVVVAAGARLSPAYNLVGGLAGVGNRAAFAISSTTHTDYEALVEVIRSHVAAEPVDPACG